MKLDFEFRNGWRKNHRKWYGFTWFTFSMVSQSVIGTSIEGTTFNFGLLGFEIYVYFLKEDSDE